MGDENTDTGGQFYMNGEPIDMSAGIPILMPGASGSGRKPPESYTGSVTFSMPIPWAVWYAICKYRMNNWRKMHGLPMFRGRRGKRFRRRLKGSERRYG